MTTEQTNHLNEMKERFKEVKQIQDSDLKNKRLSALTTDLEKVFDIPPTGILRRTAFNQAYPDVAKLHREVRAEGGF
ncbi:hypothetical protein [Paraliobacillus salinarum]|uniref:hypothetical protein n=1 Tax=Paraliobacillus salinarum TaxID=1158996 RepID=UPI0015F3F1DD|nr:hypothetical protein [Paraliobacillus salinarum]